MHVDKVLAENEELKTVNELVTGENLALKETLKEIEAAYQEAVAVEDKLKTRDQFFTKIKDYLTDLSNQSETGQMRFIALHGFGKIIKEFEEFSG